MTPNIKMIASIIMMMLLDTKPARNTREVKKKELGKARVINQDLPVPFQRKIGQH